MSAAASGHGMEATHRRRGDRSFTYDTIRTHPLGKVGLTIRRDGAERQSSTTDYIVAARLYVPTGDAMGRWIRADSWVSGDYVSDVTGAQR